MNIHVEQQTTDTCINKQSNSMKECGASPSEKYLCFEPHPIAHRD